MAFTQNKDEELKFYAPWEKPFPLAGFYWFPEDKAFRRLALKTKEPMPERVEAIAWQTSGGMVKFKTNSSGIAVKVNLNPRPSYDHMTQMTQRGFDLYYGAPGEQHFIGCTRFPADADEYTSIITKDNSVKMREYTLNFPLYGGVKELLIGLDKKAKIAPPTPWTDKRPIVIYGTSITQGGCASRPGSSWTNIVSRKLNRPIYNFGFDGNGKGEAVVAAELAQISNPAMFILDYEGNAQDAIVTTLPPFLDILREKHPEVPILVASVTRFGYEWISCEGARPEAYAARRDFQKNEVGKRRRSGDKNIYFVNGENLLTGDWDEMTVDGGHPTDYGFFTLAKNILPHIKKIISGI